jgi:hypothetical protein
MKQGSIKKEFTQKNLKSVFVFLTCLIFSACSTTSLRSFDSEGLIAANETSVFLETDCNEVSFGNDKLLDAKKQLEQAITDYGFALVDKDQADFKLNLICRKKSDLNFGIVPNGISGMIMVASITLIPTYWPTDLWLDMEVYDLRAFEAEKVDTLTASFVSQEGVIWAPFILFKLGYELGIPKYNFEKFYQGLRSSAFSLLSQAESKSIFE